MTARRRLSRLRLLPVLGLVLVAGCQVMGSSQDYVIRPDGRPERKCDSALGSYSLPFSTLKVEVTQYFKGGQRVGGAVLDVSGSQHHPDRKHVYCLDFLESPFSDDVVSVGYAEAPGNLENALSASGPSSGLLSYIVSRNTDQTGEIIRNILRAVFIAVSGRYNFSYNRASTTGLSSKVLTIQEVDPFDVEAMASLNRTLARYGYCLTLGDYSYDSNRFTPDAYCNNPDISTRPTSSPPLLAAVKQQQFLKAIPEKTILYRPRQPYSVFVHVRDDPDVGGPWHLRLIRTMMFENVSPILGLRVNRTLFAEHRTAFAFDSGNLLDVCIKKGSSVQGALQIPLDLVYGLASLPTETIRAELDLKNNSATLLQRQKELLILQNEILKAKASTFPNAANANPAKASLGTAFKVEGPPERNNGKAIGQWTKEEFSNICGAIN